jgi:hypothetical protein
VPSLPPLLATLREVIRAVDRLDADYMLIGGVALEAWAPPRATTALDLAVAVPADDLATLGKLLGRRVGGVASMRPIRSRDRRDAERGQAVSASTRVGPSIPAPVNEEPRLLHEHQSFTDKDQPAQDGPRRS